MKTSFEIIDYYPEYRSSIRKILTKIGWAEQDVSASALVTRAEEFARSKHARGIYVDTPTKNNRGRNFYEAVGYQLGCIMPRYYEDELDGVTYQKFFESKK